MQVRISKAVFISGLYFQTVQVQQELLFPFILGSTSHQWELERQIFDRVLEANLSISEGLCSTVGIFSNSIILFSQESTLKSVLSALWNLSAHCTENKADICAVDGALAFLVGTLTYRSQTNTLAIIESGGGILRNVSSLIATNEDHRYVYIF